MDVKECMNFPPKTWGGRREQTSWPATNQRLRETVQRRDEMIVINVLACAALVAVLAVTTDAHAVLKVPMVSVCILFNFHNNYFLDIRSPHHLPFRVTYTLFMCTFQILVRLGELIYLFYILYATASFAVILCRH